MRPTSAARRWPSPPISENKEAAWTYINYALGTNEGQVTHAEVLRSRPVAADCSARTRSSTSRCPIGATRRSGPTSCRPCRRLFRAAARRSRRTRIRIYRATQTKYFAGGYPDAKAALDDAANQIAVGDRSSHCEMSNGAGRAMAPGLHPSEWLVSSVRRRPDADPEPERLRVSCALSAGFCHLLDMADHQFVSDLVSEHPRQSMEIQCSSATGGASSATRPSTTRSTTR